MKTVDERRLTIIIAFIEEGGMGLAGVEGRVDYEVASDDLTVSRSMKLELGPAMEDTLKALAVTALQAVRSAEGVE